MTLTIREVLELEIMKQARAQVVAGLAGLDSPVRWVHISEQPDIAGYLKGGELLLITGMGLGHNASLHRRFIKELAAVPIAGLIVRLGGTFSTLPKSLSDEAERRGLPIIVLRRRFGAVELTERIHGAIISRQFELIAKAETVARSFTDLVMRGAPLGDVLAELAATVENPVILEDPAHQLVDFAVHNASPSAVLKAWEAHSRRGHTGDSGEVQLVEGEPGCAWAPVWLHEQKWGRLHVLELERPLRDIDKLAIDRAAAAVALTLLRDSEARRLADRASESLIADVLEGRHGDSREFLRRADACRADLHGKSLAAMVLLPTRLETFAAEHALGRYQRDALSDTMVAIVRRAVRRHGAAGLCGLDGERVLAIVGVDSQADARSVVQTIAAEACSQIGEQIGELAPAAGVSASTSVRTLRRALAEAGEAAKYARTDGAGTSIVHFADLGLQHLLLKLADGPELAHFVESELSVLLDHDASSRSPLLPTLRAFLAHGGCKTDAAAALSVERRTLYHRLSRLEKIMGRSLDDHETRFRLSLALRSLDILRQRSPLQPLS